MINAPFGDCLNAQLHRANSIQSHGAMLVVDCGSHTILAASDNIQTFIGLTVVDLLNRSINDIEGLKSISLPDRGLQAQSAGFEFQPININQTDLYLAAHVANDKWVLEFEKAPAPFTDLLWRDRQFMQSLVEIDAASSIEQTALTVMRAIARITGFDRVMLYQFLPDWHGKVIGEVLQRDVESYLGLHFPEGDVPEIARRLYLIKRQRLIQDVHDEPVPVISATPGLVVDLSLSELRAVHPTHIEYLQHMGVACSFSVSLVVEGKLWGLIACHHFTISPLDFPKRQLCEQIAYVGSIRMQGQIHLILERERLKHLMAREQIKYELLELGVGRQSIATQLSKLRRLFDADSVWACLNAVSHFEGPVPDEAALLRLRAWFAHQKDKPVTWYDALPEDLRDSNSLRECASGVICVHLPASDFLILMRSEQVREVSWAGEQPKADEPKSLTPRHSFALWRTQTSAQAKPWSEIERQEALRLRQLVQELREGLDLKRKALTDGLTGLLNRAGFDEQLKLAVQAALRSEAYCAVLMMDLDYFKPINDEFGHQAGDDVLVEVGERLKRCVRERDVVARFGGDEFAIIQFHVSDANSIEDVCKRVLAAFEKPFIIQGLSRHVGVSIGISVSPFDGTTPHTLVGRADAALYQVKNAGRNGYRFFSKRA